LIEGACFRHVLARSFTGVRVRERGGPDCGSFVGQGKMWFLHADALGLISCVCSQAGDYQKTARFYYKKAEDTYYQANNWAAYDDWRRARDQWDYFYSRNR
jgi:hypothetical protein